jgi:hypothetical protein
MAIFMDLKGTSQQSFQIQKGGARLKNVSGVIQARNAADLAFADMYGAILKAASDSIQINADAAGAGADWRYDIARPAAGMTANLTVTLPPTVGTVGQVLQTDGAGNTSWVTPAAPTGTMKVNSTTLAFGDASPKALFTLPALAAVDEVKVIIDTPFTGTPSLQVGIAGTTNKYMDTADVDLTSAAGDAWLASTNPVPVVGTEALIGTYAAGGAGAGSARIVVKYY